MTGLIFLLMILALVCVYVARWAWLEHMENDALEAIMTEENVWLVQKPGEVPRLPGEYAEVTSDGFASMPYRQVTMEPGDQRLPPTSRAGLGWRRVGPVERDVPSFDPDLFE